MHNENDNEADLLMGVEPIAKYLGVTRRQAYRLVYDKIMPSFKLGGTVAARRSSLKNGWKVWKQSTPRKPCAMCQTMCRRFPAQS